MEGHIRLARSIQEQKTSQFNKTANVAKNVCCIDVIMGCRHLYVIRMKVIAGLERK
jgi:hypothetical protein